MYLVSTDWLIGNLSHVKIIDASWHLPSTNRDGFEEYKVSPFPKYFLDEKDTIIFGNSKFDILFTPGHAPGHICLYNKENNLLIAGDVIFQGSIGRTDLPGGNHEILINSIITKLFPLPNATQIFCGHGPSTNLGYEKEHNPFLQ